VRRVARPHIDQSVIDLVRAELELRRRRAHELAQTMPLAEFVRQAWHVIEPGTELVWGWHIDAICEHLEAVTDGRVRRLIINIPPGLMKSVLVSVMWPAWMWLRGPDKRLLAGSYEQSLALRDAVRTREILTSEWFRETFLPGWTLKRGQNVKSRYANTAAGERMSFSVGGKLTGFRGNGWIVDDPLNMKDAMSEAARDEAIRVVSKALPTRLNDQRTGWRVIVMQRLHEEDPTGYLLDKSPKGWCHLCLPMEYDPEIAIATQIGWTDPRTEPGELLFEEMFPESVLADMREDLGPAEYAGQFLQRPTPAKGLVFERDWIRYVDAPPPEFDEVIISVDCAFKDLESSDHVAMGVFGKRGPNFYLLEVVHGKMSYLGTKEALRALCARWPIAHVKLVEDKANGSAIINELGREIGGLVGINPKDSKIARARAISGHVQAGNFYVLRSLPILDYLVYELTKFPLAKNDDLVDMITQALLWWLTNPDTYSLEDMTA